MLAERRKLFDTSLYPSGKPEIIAEDLAGLYIEAGDTQLENRVNARQFEIANNKVIDPKTNKEVPGELKRGTILDNLESDAAESFYNYIRSGYSLVISISPSGGISPYKESRINVGYRSKDHEMELYGIPTHLTSENLLLRSNILSEFFDVPLNIKNSDELRGIAIAITLPPNEDPPWNFLQEIFPLDSNAWEYIKQGKPWKIKDQALKDARSAARVMTTMLNSAVNAWDYIKAGAYGERHMESVGWRLNKRGCPGASNSELMSINGRNFTTDSFGNTRETLYPSFNCPKCGGSIESGKGITTCPHCGLTKEEAGSTCG